MASRQIKLSYFTIKEIENTGADIEDVRTGGLMKLDVMRRILGVPVHLLHNGITTGVHRAPEHKAGRAFDFHVEGLASRQRVICAAITAGFRGLGMYWNGSATSYHVDDRKQAAMWCGMENGIDSKWSYVELIQGN